MSTAFSFPLPFRASRKSPIKDGYALLASNETGLRAVKGDSATDCSPWIYICAVDNTELTKSTDDGCVELEIKILKTLQAGQYIRPAGCDEAAGEILHKGILLGPSETELLVSTGVTSVLVVRELVVAILSTSTSSVC